MTNTRIEIGIDCHDALILATFWSRALSYAIGDLDRAGVYLDIVPSRPEQPIIYFQVVPEVKTLKNRLHLDLYDERPEELIDRLCSLGATKIGAPRTGSEGGWWQVLADPEGNEFCVCRELDRSPLPGK